MKVGVFIGTQHTPETDTSHAYRGHLEQTALLADLGFDSIWLGQHYLTYPDHFLQPTPLLARLSAESGDMAVGTNLLLLPLHNIVDVAEQYATLDIISGGRLILGVGLGYREVEYAAFQVDKRSRGRRFDEGIALLKRLWEEDHVDWDGEFFHLRDATIRPKPLQQPRPPIWIGATKGAAITRAAIAGDAWIATSMTQWSEIPAQLQQYQQTRLDHGLPAAGEFVKCVELSIAGSREVALRDAEKYIGRKYQAYYEWGMGDNVPGQSGASLPFRELLRDRFVVGDPDDCIRACRHHRDELGVTYLLVRFNFPGMSREQVLEAITMFGKQVLPAVR